ncbi:Stage II sporulation P family protein [Thermosinus carboxydivorans Nor1]|uniref:Stage II sporulation P family protein n=1 Tax=Thermosinus carboxydivorans Nor1 TaxID=401526 RepID=A1HTV9_9FIRM|nr:stage II sporulation protein P [Thermosinus carboxydivorans]EAX46535.1 Stage II sporulation P family protein [Thermosinus carboxydivorans Nor1]
MNRLFVCALILAIGVVFTAEAFAHERNDGGYYTIVDEQGIPVYYTGWKVRVGDQCLTADNKRYEVYQIEGDTARARLIGQVNLAQYAPPTGGAMAMFEGLLQPRVARAQGGKVAIYHTHSDESYVPTDGTESKLGAGGIYKVGDSFAQALKTKGLDAIHSQAKHDPHDDMAYERSRRTVLDLLKQQPDAIFDIHRDAVPAEVYKANVAGQDISKVQLVVGKYGPTSKQIEDYALQIKAAADKQHPGLVKGIFFAKGGDYNQDLHPRSMLLEVGAHTNTRDSAEKGIALFADVVPTVLGKTAPGSQATNGSAGLGTAATGPSGASKSIGWILGLLVVGGAAFLFLSTGGLKEAGAKLKQFTSSEFTNFLGPRLKGKRSNNPNDRDDSDSK